MSENSKYPPDDWFELFFGYREETKVQNIQNANNSKKLKKYLANINTISSSTTESWGSLVKLIQAEKTSFFGKSLQDPATFTSLNGLKLHSHINTSYYSLMIKRDKEDCIFQCFTNLDYLLTPLDKVSNSIQGYHKSNIALSNIACPIELWKRSNLCGENDTMVNLVFDSKESSKFPELNSIFTCTKGYIQTRPEFLNKKSTEQSTVLRSINMQNVIDSLTLNALIKIQVDSSYSFSKDRNVEMTGSCTQVLCSFFPLLNCSSETTTFLESIRYTFMLMQFRSLFAFGALKAYKEKRRIQVYVPIIMSNASESLSKRLIVKAIQVAIFDYQKSPLDVHIVSESNDDHFYKNLKCGTGREISHTLIKTDTYSTILEKPPILLPSSQKSWLSYCDKLKSPSHFEETKALLYDIFAPRFRR